MNAVVAAAAAGESNAPDGTYGFGAVGLAAAAAAAAAVEAVDAEDTEGYLDVDEEEQTSGVFIRKPATAAVLDPSHLGVQRCGECDEETADGRVDPENGAFYCDGCWISFEDF